MWAVQNTYKVGRARVGIRATSERFGVWLDGALAPHRMIRPVTPMYSVVVADERGPSGTTRFHVLYKGISPLVRTTHLPTLARALLADLESHLFADVEDAIHVRGGIVSTESATALVPGWMVGHLSTMARRASAVGVALPASEWIAVDPTSGKVVPAAARLRAWDAVEELEDGRPAPPRAFVDRPVSVDAVVAYEEGQEQVAPAGRALALYQFAAGAANLDRLGRRALDGLRRLLEGSRVYGVGAAPPRPMIDGLAAVLGGAR